MRIQAGNQDLEWRTGIQMSKVQAKPGFQQARLQLQATLMT